MASNTDKNKLYEVVKHTLSNYEAPIGTTDWPQMEELLDLAPKSKSLEFKRILQLVFESLKSIPKSNSFKRINLPYILVGLAVLVGVYFLYPYLNSNKTSTSISSEPPKKIEKVLPENLVPEKKLPEKIVPENTILKKIATETKPQVIAALETIPEIPKWYNELQQSNNTSYSMFPIKKKDPVKIVQPAVVKKETLLIEKITNVDSIAKNDSIIKLQQASKSEIINPVNGSADSARKATEQLKVEETAAKAAKKLSDKRSSDSITRFLNQLLPDSLGINK